MVDSEDKPRLSDDEIAARAAAWFDEVWKAPRLCSVCGASRWLPATTAQVYTFGRGTLGGGGQHYPLLVVLCDNCGHTVLFFASYAGFDSEELDRRELDTVVAAPILQPNPSAVAELGGLRHREMQAISTRLGRISKHPYDRWFGAVALTFLGAAIGGAVALVPFWATHPSHQAKVYYLLALGMAAAFAAICTVCRATVAETKEDSVVAIKEDLDVILAAYSQEQTVSDLVNTVVEGADEYRDLSEEANRTIKDLRGQLEASGHAISAMRVKADEAIRVQHKLEKELSEQQERSKESS